MLKNDLYDVMVACVNGNLQNNLPEFHSNRSAVTVVLASEGYPGCYKKGMVIDGLQNMKVRICVLNFRTTHNSSRFRKTETLGGHFC